MERKERQDARCVCVCVLCSAVAPGVPFNTLLRSQLDMAQ